MLALKLSNAKGSFDLSGLFVSLNLSGAYNLCARMVSVDVVVSPYDKRVPIIDYALGSGITLDVDGKRMFTGMLRSKEKSTRESVMTLVAYDYGFILKKNTASYKFTGQSPQRIAQRICSDFGLQTGALAVAGGTVSRKFTNSSLYSIIQTAYTLGGGDKRYMIRFNGGGKMEVIEKKITTTAKPIETGKNLIFSSYSESVEDLINCVFVRDKEGALVKTIENKDYSKRFGRTGTTIVKNDKENFNTTAKRLLEDSGIEQKINLENLGDSSYISGNTVAVREPFTGLNCVFWIDSDIHSWKDGVYTNKLTLNFKNVMDKQEGGGKL